MLTPITTSDLRGRPRQRRKELSVLDGNGNVVVEAKLGRSAKPGVAKIVTVDGRWRIERRKRPWTRKGPRALWWDVPANQDLVVIDTSNQDVATLRGAELMLADGEVLTWVGPRIWSSLCGLGDGLWVARWRVPRRRGFKAEVSGAMLAREDRALLTGVGAVLTVMSRTNRNGGAADLGASIGAGLGVI